MAAPTARLYEGLFLLNQNFAADLPAATEHVKTILERHQAEIVLLKKWDDRKLAYPVRGQKRGTYLLAFFNAPTNQIIAIDRDCNLSEQVQRALIIKAEHVGETELEAARRDETVAQTEARLRGDSPENERGEGAAETTETKGQDEAPRAAKSRKNDLAVNLEEAQDA